MELIDRNALDFDEKTITQIYEMIMDAPTVDAVPVQCGECIHWIDCEGGLCTRENLFECPNFGKTDFCNYGERRREFPQELKPKEGRT